jgi:predicted nucleotidyltransferase
MNTSKNLPGSSRHQQMLQTIIDFYEADERVLAVLLFGSLSRGHWDQYSDLDLDVVMADNSLIDARVELKKLCTEIEQKHGFDALIIADIEEGDVVLGNLMEFSIRYHILSDTKPAILDTMRSLSGSLSLDEIRAAANYDYNAEPKELDEQINSYLRFTLELHNAIRRQRLWMAVEMLHRIRALLMSIYATSHNAMRPIHFFDSHSNSELHELLSSLSPQANPDSVEAAFQTAISLLDNHLDYFTNGSYQLTTSQKHILYKLKQL